MANSIRFKRYKWGRKTYHQVFVDGRVIGSLQKNGRWWKICRWHDFGGISTDRTQLIQKLVEKKTNA